MLGSLGGFDVIGEQLEDREVGILHVAQARLPLLGERAYHVAREDQKPGPRREREQGVAVEPRQHVQALHVLIERHQGHDEQPSQDREPPAAVKAGEDHRQIVEAQERELLLYEGVDRHHGEHEEQYENPLEMAEEEELGALQ